MKRNNSINKYISLKEKNGHIFFSIIDPCCKVTRKGSFLVCQKKCFLMNINVKLLITLNKILES